MFEPFDWPEWGVGLLLLVISLIVLCTCLIILVKVLSSIFKGHLKNILVKTINANFPGKLSFKIDFHKKLIISRSISVFNAIILPLILHPYIFSPPILLTLGGECTKGRLDVSCFRSLPPSPPNEL